MSDFGLSKESVKGLGAGAYLVNVLPSAVLVLGLIALLTSRLYPWQAPTGTPAGVASVAAAFKNVSARDAIALVLAVLVAAVLLRPFQISAVQFLEGYWRSRAIPRSITALAIERHARRRSLHLARSLESLEPHITTPNFAVVADQARRQNRDERRTKAAAEVVAQYPGRAEWIMPTLLGNILRRAETTAGERYGLRTVVVTPRLYPYLSPQLREEYQVQLNVLDTAATMAIVCGVLAAWATPLLARFDAWSLVVVGLVVASGLSYRGARIAAQYHAILLAAAFDLHRFDMLKAMHRKLPPTAVEEIEENEVLCAVLEGMHLGEYPDPASWIYGHETATAGIQPAEPARAPEAAPPAPATSRDDGDRESDQPATDPEEA